MTAQAPLDRLAPQDFYRQLDYIRDDWATVEEAAMTKKLGRLRQSFQHLPSRYWEEAAPILLALGRDRLANNSPWRTRLLELRGIVSQWDRTRPPILECPECGITIRGHRLLATHRYVLHDVEDDA